jgi:hypothetical protein
MHDSAPHAVRSGPFNGWEIHGDVRPEVIQQLPAQQLPAPATGRYVMALEPPPGDGGAEQEGLEWDGVRFDQLALVWTNAGGKEVLHPLAHSGCLLGWCRSDATWLPEGWTAEVFPAGWTLDHLEAWFRYALVMAGEDTINNKRRDIPSGSDWSPAYAPTPRGLVTHAHLILRHLGLPNSPTEPRGAMDRAGCLAELRDVLGFLRRAMSATKRPEPGAGRPQARRRRCRLRIAGKKVLLDGEPVALSLTAEHRQVVLCYLGHLIRAAGDWVSTKDIDSAEDRRPGKGLAGQRWDKVRLGLPECLLQLTEARRGAGSRLVPAAWRN